MMCKSLRELSLLSLETRNLRGFKFCLQASKVYIEESQTFSEPDNRSVRTNTQRLQQEDLPGYKAKFCTVKQLRTGGGAQRGCCLHPLRFQNTPRQGIWTTWSNHEVSSALIRDPSQFNIFYDSIITWNITGFKSIWSIWVKDSDLKFMNDSNR